MNTVKSVVIDNFFSDPNIIRNWGLGEKFYNSKELTEITSKVTKAENYFPGLRTLPLTQLESSYSKLILSNVARIGKHIFGLQGDLDIVASFQLTTENDYDMANIHTDTSSDPRIALAGVIYLTPKAPLDAGTTLYTKPPHEVTDTIGNVYNRLVLYNASAYHRANRYFGNDMKTGRLTMACFIRKI